MPKETPRSEAVSDGHVGVAARSSPAKLINKRGDAGRHHVYNSW